VQKKQDGSSKDVAQIISSCYERIGIVYLELKDYQNSLETFHDLYSFINSETGPYLIGETNPLYIQIHHYLSVAHYHLGNINESTSQLEHATEVGLSKSNDSELNGKIRELYMGIMKFIKNDYNKSLKSMLNVADYLTKISAKESPETIDSLLMIADYYRKLNGDKQALEIYMRAKKMILDAHGDKSTEYINILKEISITQKNMNELKSAFNIQLDILEKVRQNGGKNAFIDALMDLADILSQQAKYTEAVFSAEMAFKVSNKVYWLKHEKTIQVYNFLMDLINKIPNKELYSHYENLRDVMVSEDIIKQKVKSEYKSS